MRVLVGGGTGFIGTALTQLLKARGHEVTLVSRKPGPGRITWDELATSGLPRCDAAVNLAGENILNPLRRWNEAFQKEVLSSRLETTQLLARAISKAPQPLGAWVLVTGVAYYQPSLTAEYDEDSPGGDFDFFSNLVTKWEAAARLPGDSTRQVVVRSDGRMGSPNKSHTLGLLELSQNGKSEEGAMRNSGACQEAEGPPCTILLASSRGCAGPWGWCHWSYAAALPPGPGGPHRLRPTILPLDSYWGPGRDPGPCP
uniref:Short chain dehydrogenase/reductase family 39U member 1 n=1 Tax=Molossus molossus TaxID=27622 RepID=A0A7J8K057_MOLMO|nr:short chain dehydrogenase/reductase family 39U member 1 [Molossus molossus]